MACKIIFCSEFPDILIRLAGKREEAELHRQIQRVMRFRQTQQEVLQAFAFSVVTVNDKHTNLGSKECEGVKFKEDRCAELFKALV